MTVIDEFSDAREMLEEAGIAAATIAGFKNPHFAASQVSYRQIIAMGILIGNLGFARPDLLLNRTKKDQTATQGGA